MVRGVQVLIESLLVVAVSSYGFAVAVQTLRGRHLEFKPFSCRLCLSWWFSFLYVLFTAKDLVSAVLYGFFSVFVSYMVGLLEPKVRKPWED